MTASEKLLPEQAAKALLRMKEQIDRLEQRRREPIAVVGFAERLPFESRGVSTWQGLSEGIDASTVVPTERWDAAAHYDPDPEARFKSITKRGSFLADIRSFDAGFFSIPPVEAMAMDPMQRMALEIAWQALEDAGLPQEKLSACSTGVFMGVMSQEYGSLCAADELPDDLVPYTSIGNAVAVIAGRMSYALGLTGPSMVVETLCSSSLVAVHEASESLRAGSSDVALAGGVNAMVSPLSSVMISKLRALSPDGRCKSFDASGDGYGRGEGCAIVVLKRLSDALRDGDRVHAVLRGSAVNQDGRSDGLTAPSGAAQQRLLRRALEFARLTPADVQYVEAHGTGTVLGDPIEVDALNEVFGGERAVPLAIGSIKSNIGHLEGAAGISGFIKVLLAIRHRLVPPSLHFRTPNPHVPWDQIPIRVQTELGPWPAPRQPLIAGISSFGLSGTNAHAIVSEPPVAPAGTFDEADRLARAASVLPLCVSARTPEALRACAERLADHLAAPLEGCTWRDVAFTANVRRTHLEHRLLVTGADAAEWSQRLRDFAARGDGGIAADATRGSDRVVFVFSGQGTQWWGMARGLMEREPEFRAALEECAGHIGREGGCSLLEELGRGEESSRLDRTDIAQPALVALQLALVRLLGTWGVAPAAVVGHSVGEIAAACAAGVLTVEEACRLAVIRGRVMHAASGSGRMIAVQMSAERAAEVARESGGRLVVGAINAPESVVLSGDGDAVHELEQRVAAAGGVATVLRGSYPFHSPRMAPFMRELTDALGWLRPAPAKLPMASTLRGAVEASSYDATYWASQMREPVRFAPAVQGLLAREFDLFLEVGPHPALLGAIDELARERAKRAAVVPTLRRNTEQTRCMVESLGGLHCAGFPVDWSKYFAVRGRVVSLPSYAWQREPFWLPAAALNGSRRRGKDRNATALLDRAFSATDDPRRLVYEVEVGAQAAPELLAHHKVHGVPCLAAGALLELVLQGASRALPGDAAQLSGLVFAQPLTVADGDVATAQLVIDAEGGGARAFRFASFSRSASEPAWREHARGEIQVRPGSAQRAPGVEPDLEAIRSRCSLEVDVGELYGDDETAAVWWGASLRSLERVWKGDGEVLAQLRPLAGEASAGFILHPGVLAGALRAAIVAQDDGPASLAVAACASVQVWPAGRVRWVHAQRRAYDSAGLEYDLRLLNEGGTTVALLTGLRMLPLDPREDRLERALFEVRWRTRPSPATVHALGKWLVLSDTETGPTLRAWLEERGAQVVTVARGVGYSRLDETHFEVDPLQADSFARVLRDAYGEHPPERIVHLHSLAATSSGDALDPQGFFDARDATCITALHLVQAITAMGWQEVPRLFLVTRGCQPALGAADVNNPAHALLWGFAGSLGHELPELRSTLVDLDSDTTVEALAQALAGCDGEDRVALRAGVRLVPRLGRAARTAGAGADIRPDATYLISGGLGGLGLVVAERLAQLGAKHVALMSRGTPSDIARQTIAALQALGVEVHLVRCDVEDADRVRAAVSDLQRSAPAVAGLVHAAGTLDDGSVLNLDMSRFGPVLGAKARGALVLENALPALQWRAYFASAAGVLGAPGQANYAAANAFLDALAHHLDARGKRVLSLDWGAWADVGMAAQAERAHDQLARQGLATLSPADGAELFERALGSTNVQLMAMWIDFGQWRQGNPRVAAMPLLQDLLRADARDAQATYPAATPANLLESAHAWALAGSALELPGDTMHHVLRLGLRHQPYLADHQVHGRVVVPGTFYLSVVLAIVAEHLEGRQAELRNVQWTAPLFLDHDTDLHVVLSPADDGYSFSMMTRERTAAGGSWRVHARGEARVPSGLSPVSVDVAAWKRRVPNAADASVITEALARSNIVWGPQWHRISAVFWNGAEGLVRLEPHQTRSQEAPVHPVFFDNAFAAVFYALFAAGPRSLEDAPATFLPFGLGTMRWLMSPVGPLWAHAEIRERTEETVVADVTLADERGAVVAMLEGMTAKRAPRDAFLKPPVAAPGVDELDDWLFEVTWQAAPKPSSESAKLEGRWLLIGDGPSASPLREALEAAGAEVVTIEHATGTPTQAGQRYTADLLLPEQVTRILQEACGKHAPRAIVHLAKIGRAADAAGLLDDAFLRRVQEDICAVPLHVMHAASRAGWPTPPPLLFVTHGCQPATGSQDVQYPEHALLWGFIASATEEMPELRLRLIDAPADGDAAAVAGELGRTTPENRVALRGDQRLVPRLIKHVTLPGRQRTHIVADRTYLVTGGLGQLGLIAARRLAASGARHLALLGRHPPTDEASVAIRELEGDGVGIQVIQADVSEPHSLAGALAELARRGPPITGLVHAAGVLDDAALLELAAPRIGPVLAPKVAGVVALERLLPQLALRVYFSSAAGVLGSARQAHHAAASAFLDAFAHHLTARSKRALSLDWGPWMETELAARADRLQTATPHGLGTFSVAQGGAMFDRLLLSSRTQLVPIALDLRRFLQSRPRMASAPLLLELQRSDSSRRTARGANDAVLRQLASGRTAAERTGVLEDYLRSTIATVLRSSAEQVPLDTPLTRLGLDSLMNINLKNTLERELGIQLPSGALFAHPTVERLAGYLTGKMPGAADAPATNELAAAPAARAQERASTHEPSSGEGKSSADDRLRAEMEAMRKLGFVKRDR